MKRNKIEYLEDKDSKECALLAIVCDFAENLGYAVFHYKTRQIEFFNDRETALIKHFHYSDEEYFKSEEERLLKLK